MRSAASQWPVRVTRTSLPAAAVVASTNRCRARRVLAITDSSTLRSTAGRQVDTHTAGSAHSTNEINAGWIEASNATDTARRTIQPSVENSDMKR